MWVQLLGVTTMTRQAKLIASHTNIDGTFNAVLEDVQTKEQFEIKNAFVTDIQDPQMQSFDGMPITMCFNFEAASL